MKNSNSIFLSLGSNIGDKESNLIDAMRLISNFAKIIKMSSLYKTEPLLYKEQDDFFNLVIEIEYQETARNLLVKIKEIEKEDFVFLGYHSHSHEYLINYNFKNFKRDIDESIKIFENLL